MTSRLSLMPQPKPDKVSAQHTLERVRNNQRQHRARRKAYIAELERKLGEAEQAASDLRNQVQGLQAELAECHRHNGATCSALQQPQTQSDITPPPPPDTLETGPPSGVSSITDALEALGETTTSLPIDLSDPSDLPLGIGDPPGLFTAVSSPADGAEGPITAQLWSPAIGPTSISSTCHAGLTLATASPRTAEGTITLQTTTAAPYAQPAVNAMDQIALTPSNGGRHSLLPAYVFESGTEIYPEVNGAGESTMLCSEAYILIAQQNLRGVSAGDVDLWLWNGFRKARQPRDGCRVRTDTLFSLLAFISDTE